ncbi:MAG TPA: hypothetical protein VK437_05715 [Steroidobacteraceae bacterium]|nr:hypothetical protein [Steroidobacteraceae bacterium]
MDNALLSDFQPFFAGWTEQDYTDASAWAQACAQYGWHVPGRPRIPLLQAQHDRALGSAQTQSGSGALASGVGPAAAAPSPAAAAPSPAAAALSPAAAPSAPAQATDQSAPLAQGMPGVQAAAPVQSSTPAQAAAPVEPSTSVQALPAVQSNPAMQAPSAPAAAAIGAGTPANGTLTPAMLPAPIPVQAAGATALPAVQANLAAQASPPLASGAPVAPAPPVAAEMKAQAQPLLTAATGGMPLATPAEVTTLAPSVSSAATGSAIPQAQAVAGAAAGGSLMSSRPRESAAPDGEGYSLVTDDYFREHFHQEALWVAARANLDIGEDRGPSTWLSSGTSAQMKNRLTADKIVLYCAKKTNAGKADARPLLWDWRWCEAEEAAAYNRLVTGNEFPTAGRGIVLGCTGVDSYVHLERCIQTLTESAKPTLSRP